MELPAGGSIGAVVPGVTTATAATNAAVIGAWAHGQVRKIEGLVRTDGLSLDSAAEAWARLGVPGPVPAQDAQPTVVSLQPRVVPPSEVRGRVDGAQAERLGQRAPEGQAAALCGSPRVTMAKVLDVRPLEAAEGADARAVSALRGSGSQLVLGQAEDGSPAVQSQALEALVEQKVRAALDDLARKVSHLEERVTKGLEQCNLKLNELGARTQATQAMQQDYAVDLSALRRELAALKSADLSALEDKINACDTSALSISNADIKKQPGIARGGASKGVELKDLKDTDTRSPSPGGRCLKLEAARASRHAEAARRLSDGGASPGRGAKAASLSKTTNKAAGGGGEALPAALRRSLSEIGQRSPSSPRLGGTSVRVATTQSSAQSPDLSARRPLTARGGAAGTGPANAVGEPKRPRAVQPRKNLG